MPYVAYALTLKEKRDVCKYLIWCINVDEGKMFGMETHDCYVFMQGVLTPIFRESLPKHVYEPLAEMWMFFKQLCFKV